MRLEELKKSYTPEGVIKFYLKGELVGSTDLYSFTDMNARHDIAKSIGIEHYNNFHLCLQDGTIRVDASKTSGMFGKDNADVQDLGMYEGYMYSNMSLKDSILSWAKERDLINTGNATKQIIKLTEEVGELAGAYLKSKDEEVIDAIGDIQVVLIILAEQLGLDYDKCLELAYNVIKNRKGKTVDGTFIKES